MKIKWTGGERYVPAVGTMTEGDVRDVPDAIGESLIKQGLAEETKTKKKGKGE